MTELSLIGAALAGLLGGAHCAGMCGPLLCLASAARPLSWQLHLAYNTGRIASYATAGALAGALGETGLLLRGALPMQQLLIAIASATLIVLGLYLIGHARYLRRIEAVGAVLWRALRPLSSRLLPADTLPRALGFGALWGWLPCGMVYGVLLLALASGNAANGAAILLAFGLGTLPNLIAIGLLLPHVRTFTSPARFVAGVALAAFGAYGLIGLVATPDLPAPSHLHAHVHR